MVCRVLLRLQFDRFLLEKIPCHSTVTHDCTTRVKTRSLLAFSMVFHPVYAPCCIRVHAVAAVAAVAAPKAAILGTKVSAWLLSLQLHMYTLIAFMTALCGVYSSGVSRQDCLKHITARLSPCCCWLSLVKYTASCYHCCT